MHMLPIRLLIPHSRKFRNDKKKTIKNKTFAEIVSAEKRFPHNNGNETLWMKNFFQKSFVNFTFLILNFYDLRSCSNRIEMLILVCGKKKLWKFFSMTILFKSFAAKTFSRNQLNNVQTNEYKRRLLYTRRVYAVVRLGR